MKTLPAFNWLKLGSLALAFASAALSQTVFDSGSNGSYGSLNVTGSVTLDMPPDGVFHCTTITIGGGGYLAFKKNSSNTPVYLLATGDVQIDGHIDVSGRGAIGSQGGEGGPGGFAGGNGGVAAGQGEGPGGGAGGWINGSPPSGKLNRGGGGFASLGQNSTPAGGLTYGNPLLIPLIGGSGGGGGEDILPANHYGGGGGGGAILIASNTRIVCRYNGSNFTAFINASGAGTPDNLGVGSGGAVRLIAPLVSGETGIGVASGSNSEGKGRIRIDALSRSLNINRGNPEQASWGANLVVFPSDMPRIRITRVAGTDISPDRVDPVFVLLPTGSSATQAVNVQVENFRSIVPLVAVITPEAGERTTYNFDVNNTASGVATGSVNVQVPAGLSTRIDVWTR